MAKTYFNLDRVDNRLRFLGDFRSGDVRRVFAATHQLVNNKGYSDIHLDFSQCNSAFSSALLPLICQVDNFRSNRIDCTVSLPSDEKLKKMFLNANWAHFIEPRSFPLSTSKTFRQIPAIRYRDSTEQNDAVTAIMERVLSGISQFDRGDFAALEWALAEVTDNVLNHSNSKDGGYVQLTIFDARTRAVELTVADGGVGVHQTIRDAFNGITSDSDALMTAVKEGVTRNKTKYQGNGLYGSLEISRQGSGSFSLASGHSTLKATFDGVTCIAESIPFTGTAVDMQVSFREPGQLARALSFNGKVHSPLDIIESRYESDDLQRAHVPIRDHKEGVRSRKAAAPLYIRLLNLVNVCAGAEVVIDFSGVSVISSSFADEVFGKLFKTLGPMTFMRSIKIANATPTVQTLIDRAIIQRMSEPRE